MTPAPDSAAFRADAAARIVEHVAVEQFDALVAGGADFGDRPAHVAEGQIGELTDRGDANRIATQRPPTVGLIGKSHVHAPSSH